MYKMSRDESFGDEMLNDAIENLVKKKKRSSNKQHFTNLNVILR
jgi:hypothetical protein